MCQDIKIHVSVQEPDRHGSPKTGLTKIYDMRENMWQA